MKTPFKIILITLIIFIKSVVQTISAQAIINNQSAIINKKDSLFTLLKTAKVDTTLVNTYNALSREYNRSNPDTAMYFGNLALKLAIKANYKKGIATSYTNIGVIHMYKGDYDKAIDVCFKSLKILEELGDKKGMSDSYNNIGNIHYYKGDYDKAIDVCFKSLKILEELGDKKGMAGSYNNIGLIHSDKGDYDKAIDFDFKSLKIKEELLEQSGNPDSKAYREAQRGMSDSYNNIGSIHMYKGDYDLALEFYFKSLKIKEELGDKKGMAMSYNNIGNIHLYKGDYDLALEFYFKSLKIREELGDKRGMAASLGNIGNIHAYKGDYDKAIDFYFKDLKIKEEIGDKNGMSVSYNNIGNIHYYKGGSQLDKEIQRDEYDLAIEFYFKSLKINEEFGDKKGMSASYNNIGNLYLMQGKANEAKQQQLLALNIAVEIGAKQEMYYAYNSLAQCDSALGNFKGAYEYHKLYSQIHDSVFSKESNDKIAEMGAKYEAEKRELTIQKLEKEKLLQDETLARKEAESKKQRILLFSFLAGFIIILVFSVFLYRLFVQKKMANAILEQQKEEISAQRDEIETQRDLVTEQKEHIEEIHKEVTDSINYAKRIQEAMLPALSTNLTGFENLSGFSNLETFILFKPKDVVSGDFYWSSKVNEYQIYAVADCTGHGVPGAFMSMLGISFLNEIVRKKEVTQASHVLDQLRVSIIDALKQTGGSGTQKDGMDMSLVVIKNQEPSSKSQIPNSKNQENEEQLNIRTIEQSNQEQQTSNSKLQTSNFFNAQWAGANNPLWLVRCSKNLTGFENLSGLEEIKPDKQPIAIHPEMKDFTNHEIQLSKGDTIYLASDGYEDQFGGEKGKKFLSKNLKQLLIANCQLPMSEQKEMLETTFENWKGDHEQIDDVTILGIRI